MYLDKIGCIRANWLYLGKVVVIGQIRCSWAKLVVFGQNGCIRARWLYSSKVVVFGQSGCIWAKVVVFGKLVVVGQNRFCLGI